MLRRRRTGPTNGAHWRHIAGRRRRNGWLARAAPSCHAPEYRDVIGPSAGLDGLLRRLALDDQAVGRGIHDDRVTRLEGGLEHPLGQGILDLVLDLAAQRSSAEGEVVAL